MRTDKLYARPQVNPACEAELRRQLRFHMRAEDTRPPPFPLAVEDPPPPPAKAATLWQRLLAWWRS